MAWTGQGRVEIWISFDNFLGFGLMNRQISIVLITLVTAWETSFMSFKLEVLEVASTRPGIYVFVPVLDVL